MTTMNISLPEPLKKFIDERVSSAGYGTTSEYIRDLIRRDQQKVALRNLILDGAATPITGEANTSYFDHLRTQAVNSSAK